MSKRETRKVLKMGWNGEMEEVSGLREMAKGLRKVMQLGETTFRMESFVVSIGIEGGEP